MVREVALAALIDAGLPVARALERAASTIVRPFFCRRPIV
jgi:hypothetical protein